MPSSRRPLPGRQIAKAILPRGASIHARTFLATNSAPLSGLMYFGGLRSTKKSVKASTTSVELSLRFTRIIPLTGRRCVHRRKVGTSFVNSSMMLSVRNIRPFWPKPYGRSVVQPEPALLGLFLWDLQPLPSPKSVRPLPLSSLLAAMRGALVIYMPAAVVQHSGDHAVSMAFELFRHCDDILGQTRPKLSCPASDPTPHV